jgi:hypothetical protein
MRSDATAVGLPLPGRDGVERAAGTVLCSRAALSNLTTGAVAVGGGLNRDRGLFCGARASYPPHLPKLCYDITTGDVHSLC